VWQQLAGQYQINTFILPLARVHRTPLQRLKDFCNSKLWRPVYLDEVSVVFVRRTPATEPLIKRSEVDCSSAPLPTQTLFDSRGFAFNRWANTAAVLAALGRSYEALAATDMAQRIFADSSSVHWLRGNLFAGMARTQEAEDEFLRAAALDPSENTLSSLGMLYYRQSRGPEARRAMQEAVDVSLQPYLANLRFAHFYLKSAETKLALQSLEEVLRRAPDDALAETGSGSLRFQVARMRAEACQRQGDLLRAIAFGEEAVQLGPGDATAWADLAKLYALDGRAADGLRAEKRAGELTPKE
jgi:tetratricopeptide (TPR) repeat protein